MPRFRAFVRCDSTSLFYPSLFTDETLLPPFIICLSSIDFDMMLKATILCVWETTMDCNVKPHQLVQCCFPLCCFFWIDGSLDDFGLFCCLLLVRISLLCTLGVCGVLL